MRLFPRALVVAALLLCCPVSAGAFQAGLPAAWDGVWKGPTTLTWADGRTEAVGMELYVSPLPGGRAKTWTTVYVLPDLRETREYHIKPAEGGGAGRLLIDERNGFLIDNYLAGDTLYSRFTVNNNLVTTRFELRGETIEVELTMFDLKTPRVTRLTGGAFEVASFAPKYVQRGALRRAPPEPTPKPPPPRQP